MKLTKGLALFASLLVFIICCSAIAEGSNNKGKSAQKPAIKLPEFKDVTFTEDDQKFYVYLNEFFPDRAADLKALENNPEQFQERLKFHKWKCTRIWAGYKENKDYGKLLVQEVQLRLQRNPVLDKLKAAKDNKTKDRLRAELTKIVSKEFDIAVQIKKYWYAKLRNRTKRMDKELANRQDEVKKLVENKDQEVSKRVKSLIAGEEKRNWDPKLHGPSLKEAPNVKLPTFKGITFDEDDQKFFVYLSQYFPRDAEEFKGLEKDPKAYEKQFRSTKSTFRRLWKYYKSDRKHGLLIIDEVKLRNIRGDLLDKYNAAKDEKQKAAFRKSLTDAVSKEFDTAIKIKKHKYQVLSNRIGRMKGYLARREKDLPILIENKENEVKKRVDDLVSGKEKINWKK